MRRLSVLLALVLVGSAFAQPRMARTTLLKVFAPDLAWAENRLADKLTVALSREGRLEIQQADHAGDRLPPFPTSAFHLDSLVAWGQEAGGRYLLVVQVDREELLRRKSWKLPLIFHRWETIGVVSGEVRLIDLARGRLVVAEPFETVMKARAVFQASMDDNRNDPDLRLSASEKIRFFSELEDRACADIVSQLNRLTGSY